MIVDARNREINLGSHVRYVDTGTVGEVTDSKVENDASWVKIDKTNLWYLANKLELLNDVILFHWLHLNYRRMFS